MPDMVQRWLSGYAEFSRGPQSFSEVFLCLLTIQEESIRKGVMSKKSIRIKCNTYTEVEMIEVYFIIVD
jgi:hypothetical protein